MPSLRHRKTDGTTAECVCGIATAPSVYDCSVVPTHTTWTRTRSKVPEFMPLVIICSLRSRASPLPSNCSIQHRVKRFWRFPCDAVLVLRTVVCNQGVLASNVAPSGS